MIYPWKSGMFQHMQTNIRDVYNRMKDKNHIMSVYRRKSFDEIQHTYMLRTVNKLGKET